MITWKRLVAVLLLLLSLAICSYGTIQYSGSAFSTSITCTGVKQDLINSIETALLHGGAGWTTVSGSGTTNLVMLSGTTPQSLQIRARFKDNAGNGIQVYMENSTSTLADTVDTSHGSTLLATSGRVYQVIGSLYQFIISSPAGPGAYNRGFVWIGMPYLPPFLASVTTAAGWMCSNSITDADATTRNSVASVGIVSDYAVPPNTEALLNGNYWSISNNGLGRSDQNIGTLRMVWTIVCSESRYVTAPMPNTYRWGDNSQITADIYMAWGDGNTAYEAKLRGQIWDAFYTPNGYPSGSIVTFSGHNFMNVVAESLGNTIPMFPASIWFATS